MINRTKRCRSGRTNCPEYSGPPRSFTACVRSLMPPRDDLTTTYGRQLLIRNDLALVGFTRCAEKIFALRVMYYQKPPMDARV